MKKLFLLVVVMLASIGMVSAQAAFKFKEAEKTHDFGTIPEGPSVAYTFEFTNTGNEPLIITNVSASCGCTVPKWTKEPVAPGAKGSIDVTYNTKGRPGPFTKSITITSNAGVVKDAKKPSAPTSKQDMLQIKGSVQGGTSQSTPASVPAVAPAKK